MWDHAKGLPKFREIFGPVCLTDVLSKHPHDHSDHQEPQRLLKFGENIDFSLTSLK